MRTAVGVGEEKVVVSAGQAAVGLELNVGVPKRAELVYIIVGDKVISKLVRMET